MENEYKNALPREVDDHPDSGMPRQSRTHADNEPSLSAEEAKVAGMTTEPETVYGESDADQNRGDQRDAHRAQPGEHV
ncbi:MAG: hypothetical protein ABR591_05630 [Candidatus Velthaea sp.]